MTKQLLVLAILILAFVYAKAQIHQDVLYLKNGGILRGKVLENDDENTVKIEIFGGNVFVVNSDEIEKRTTEAAPSLKNTGIITHQPDGFYNMINFGLPIGQGQFGALAGGICLNYVKGYQIYLPLKIGVGTGIDYYGYEATTIPLFVRVTGDFSEKNSTPFYVADIGYAANISATVGDEEHKGGLRLFLGGGIKFNTRTKKMYELGLGYKLQFTSSHYKQSFYPEPYEEYRTYSRIELRVGMGF